MWYWGFCQNLISQYGRIVEILYFYQNQIMSAYFTDCWQPRKQSLMNVSNSLDIWLYCIIAALETILTLSTILSMLREQISLPYTTKPPGPFSYTQPEIQLPKFGATYTCFFGVPYHDTDSNLIHTKQPILSILLHIIHTCHIISYKGSMSFKFFFSSPLPLQTSFKASIYIIWEEKKNNERFILCHL